MVKSRESYHDPRNDHDAVVVFYLYTVNERVNKGSVSGESYISYLSRGVNKLQGNSLSLLRYLLPCNISKRRKKPTSDALALRVDAGNASFGSGVPGASPRAGVAYLLVKSAISGRLRTPPDRKHTIPQDASCHYPTGIFSLNLS